jgi:hypothetical protein
MMNAALTARLVAAGRVGFGVALILTPGRVTAPWLGRDSGRAGTRVLSRGLGARDVALGVSALAVSEPPTASVGGGGDPRRHGGPSRHAGRGRLATTRRQGTCGRRGVPGAQSSAASPWQGCGLACVALDRSGLDALSPAAASTAAETSAGLSSTTGPVEDVDSVDRVLTVASSSNRPVTSAAYV